MSFRTPADFVDSSAVLRVYSYVAGTAGAIVALWGPAWTPAAAGDFEPFLITRVFGAIMIAAALCAAGLERIDDPTSRHAALFWFLLGHVVVAVMLTVQEIVIRGRLDAAAGALLGVSLVLFHFWAYPIAPARPRSIPELLRMRLAPPRDQMVLNGTRLALSPGSIVSAPGIRATSYLFAPGIWRPPRSLVHPSRDA